MLLTFAKCCWVQHIILFNWCCFEYWYIHWRPQQTINLVSVVLQLSKHQILNVQQKHHCKSQQNMNLRFCEAPWSDSYFVEFCNGLLDDDLKCVTDFRVACLVDCNQRLGGVRSTSKSFRFVHVCARWECIQKLRRLSLFPWHPPTPPNLLSSFSWL